MHSFFTFYVPWSNLSGAYVPEIYEQYNSEYIELSKQKHKELSSMFGSDYQFVDDLKYCNSLFKKYNMPMIGHNDIFNIKFMLFEEYFKTYDKLTYIDFDIIHTIRNPLSAVSSPVNNWLRYETGKHFFAKSIYFHLDLIVNGIKKLKKIKKRLFLIQLEMLHHNHFGVMNDFCKTYNLNYDDCMKYASVFNLRWWSDKISGKNLSGIDKNFKVNFIEEIFYKRDIKFLEYILRDYMKFYNYKFTNKTSKILLNFLPMKCEILTWKNTIKHKRLKHILSIPFFFIKNNFKIFINSI